MEEEEEGAEKRFCDCCRRLVEKTDCDAVVVVAAAKRGWLDWLEAAARSTRRGRDADVIFIVSVVCVLRTKVEGNLSQFGFWGRLVVQLRYD